MYYTRLYVAIVLLILFSFTIMNVLGSNTVYFNSSDEQYLLETSIKPRDLIGKEIPALTIWRGRIDRALNYISGICRCDTGLLFRNWREAELDGVIYKFSSDNGNLMVVGDNGYLYLRIGDGKSLETISYENLFENATDELYQLIGDIGKYFDVVGDGYRVVYKGLSGEEKIESIEGVAIYPNGTTKPINKTSVEYVNPYDVYYIVIDGYRLEPPIIIRAIKPGSSSLGTKVQYLKALIPIVRHYKRIRVTEEMVNEIVLTYIDRAGVDPGDVRIYDIYLAISPDNNYILPAIKVGSISSSVVYWFQITWDGKVKELVNAVFSGATGSSDQGGLIEGDEIIRRISGGGVFGLSSNNIYLVLIVATIIAIATLALIMYRRRKL